MKELKKRFKSFWKDVSGSESLEFLSSFALLLLVVVSLISVLAYAYRVNELNYAARRVVRSIEVTGMYDEAGTESMLEGLLPNTHDLNVQVTKNGATLIGAGNKIQLRETFSVTLQGTYPVQIFSGFDREALEIPIAASVHGMSEVYWKELS